MRKKEKTEGSYEQSRSVRRTKTALRNGLVGLMKTRSVLHISVKDICDTADVGRSTFYAHYKDQYDLLHQIEGETITYFVEVLEKYKSKREKNDIKQMTEELLNYIVDNGNSIQVLLSENGNINFQKKIFSFYRQKLVLKYFNNDFDKKTQEYASVYSINGFIGLIQQWLKNDMDVSASEMAELFTKLAQGKLKF